MTHDYNNIFPASVQIRFHFCFASLFLVGIGSWMFHMTLQYEMQMLDELPMVWGGLTILYCMCVIRSQQEDKQLAFYMTTIASVFTLAHLYFKLPVLLFVSTVKPRFKQSRFKGLPQFKEQSVATNYQFSYHFPLIQGNSLI